MKCPTDKDGPSTVEDQPEIVAGFYSLLCFILAHVRKFLE
jgi:hypothetical protein